ncbi:thiamine phosphate synthase [Devosia nitrariae]|uniref:Thiamine phosphate synthase n=1 Tax=Devosia nitrariae TaxID=2071872 RepID=A0ABQ5WAR3_9HYPH|nr:thiamine phosphate synthase [Devosia nitrariae]GLQ56828.1 thiamine phosphate synthase [Devosia nitrariae]
MAAAQIFLVTPQSAEPATFGPALAEVLAAAPVAALLVRRHERTDAAYRALVQAVLPAAQGADCAVLVEDDAALARRIGADGVHVTGNARSVKDAVAAVKPGLIVGAGPIRSRHEAMSLGEFNVDYLFFGDLSDPADANAREMGAWWAETFEVPSVLSGRAGEDSAGCEFLALGESFWTGAESPAALAVRAAKTLETA